MITRIQRYCIHDGPGIRTTVFLKGCNLKCIWCHNPESQSFDKELMLFRNRCISCGICEKVCPSQAIQLKNLKWLDATKCTFCGKCISSCPGGAIDLCGKDLTVGEAVNEILKDKVFFDESGGGVTFSGGEPLLQKDFLYEIAKVCKNHQIHTAVETAGNVSFDVLSRISEVIDLFLWDFKTITPQLHSQFTGCDNELILNNLMNLYTLVTSTIIRIPVIPGCNDNIDEMKKILQFICNLIDSSHNCCPYIQAVHLLPYHEFGVGKYKALGRKYLFDNSRYRPDILNQKLREFQRMFQDMCSHIPCEIYRH